MKMITHLRKSNKYFTNTNLFEVLKHLFML